MEEIESLKRMIRNERRKINCDAAGADWELYRAYQWKLARLLYEQGERRHTWVTVRVDRPALRLLNKKDFPARTGVRIGKYLVFIRENKGHTTAVELRADAVAKDLTEGNMPQYLQRFVF